MGDGGVRARPAKRLPIKQTANPKPPGPAFRPGLRVRPARRTVRRKPGRPPALGVPGAQAARPDQVHPRLPQKRTVPPNRIERYMDDLVRLLQQADYSPQVQACLPHFQIEYVKPFKSHGEALGRHVSYLVYARRGLCRTAIVPIAPTSIARINAPVDPYKVDHRSPSQQPLALWVLHGAKSLEVTASFVRDIDGRAVRHRGEMARQGQVGSQRRPLRPVAARPAGESGDQQHVRHPPQREARRRPSATPSPGCRRQASSRPLNEAAPLPPVLRGRRGGVLLPGVGRRDPAQLGAGEGAVLRLTPARLPAFARGT